MQEQEYTVRVSVLHTSPWIYYWEHLPYVAISIENISTTDTSVYLSWNSTLTPIKCNVTIAGTIHTGTRSQVYSINIEVLSNETEAKHGGLFPEQKYRICIIGVYSQQQKVSSCRNIQTAPPLLHQTPQSSHPTLHPYIPTGGEPTSCNIKLIEAILGSIIALLVILLAVAGVGLAYTHCIRSRMKTR